ncbi:uncharacterized protein AB675_4214 [Cyphellophora attinorum]|uniref:Uncharacterized protein n=1 Tax=Cyphellophora attinorum TaxID=1664694 RepID=A0A0N1P063_9EURO|nr:uncharacterized protein AB675_4214 [Phialophora attinorum]KPI38644.1 hypothetical protein AB675_4214 [Phialophora attinorum]
MDNAGEPIWPYGFRVQWSVKELFDGNDNNDTGASSALRIPIRPPSVDEIAQHIHPDIDQRLQASAVSLSQWEEKTDTLGLSHRGRRTVLQGAINDLADAEREEVLRCDSWWRQQALEYGDDHFTETESIGGSPEAAIIEYLNRAEAVRDLLIYVNKKICSTQSKSWQCDTWDYDRPAIVMHTGIGYTGDQRRKAQLEPFKKVACITALDSLCNKNGWSLVAYFCETISSTAENARLKKYRHLLTVIRKDADNVVEARAVLRPYFEDPLQALDPSAGKGSDCAWQSCEHAIEDKAAAFVPHIKDFESLKLHVDEHDVNRSTKALDPDLLRKMLMFDYPEEEDARALNPFSHFRRLGAEFEELLNPDELVGSQATMARHVGPESPSSQQRASPRTPAALRIQAYNFGSPRDLRQRLFATPPQAGSEGRTAKDGPTASQSQTTQIQKDLAILTLAVLSAREIDIADRSAVIQGRLTSVNVPVTVVRRLLCNPALVEMHPALGQKTVAEEGASHPDRPVVYNDFVDDIAVLVEALALARDINMSEDRAIVVDKFASKLIPVDVAERAIDNNRIKNKRRRWRNEQETQAKKIKLENCEDETNDGSYSRSGSESVDDSEEGQEPRDVVDSAYSSQTNMSVLRSGED